MGKREQPVRLVGAILILAACVRTVFAASGPPPKIGPLATRRASLASGTSQVIVRATDEASRPALGTAIAQAGGTVHRALPIINGYVAEIPNAALNGLANNPFVEHVALDRVVLGTIERTGATIGSTAARQDLGYDGSGVGVAVIDSGVTAWHDDLTGADGGQRVDLFVDFVNNRDTPYDDYGHGTHVAGIIAGNGFDSAGARSGIAPGARLIALRVLDSRGRGRISNLIAALDFIVAYKDVYNIRVANLSVGAGVFESYESDPLTLAAQRAVSAGIVVVAAAGNFGRDAQGRTQYAGVTAPGNAPWVLTVGASSHMGTADRADDVMAAFSSRGPTPVDYAAKPDVVAPGVGIESLSDPASALYEKQSAYLLDGTVSTWYRPYLSLSGTSMAAPVVSGTVALMLQANPALTPNAVKAILQYTSETHPDYDSLTQGAGFLNARGAIELARYFAAPSSIPYPSSSGWNAEVIWGNHLLHGGRLTAEANAWSADVVWGAATTPAGAPVEWGVICSTDACDTPDDLSNAWRVACADESCGAMVWSGDLSTNVVWGPSCGGADCDAIWTLGAGGDVFGTMDGDTVVWGSSESDTVVWGSFDGDTVVWGSSCGDPSCEPVIWNR
jgi:serine protease AprX